MGIRIAIGNLCIGSSQSLSSYWTHQLNFYELWKVTGAGTMTGLIKGDPLTITGSGLNAIYAVPDNATYKALDTDYCFHKMDGSVSTLCDGNRLIGYDFPRIIIKYLDASPYTIEYIGILDTGQSVNNRMRDDFHLSTWWDNTLSLYGYVKQNRITGMSVFIPQSGIYCDEYDIAHYYFGTKPSSGDAVIQNTMLKALVDGGYFAKAELIDVFSMHNEVDSLWNLKDPTKFNPSKDLNPTWTIYEGFTGGTRGERYNLINLNFNPSTDGTLVGQDNICVIIGVGSDIDTIYGADADFGGSSADDVSCLEINSRYYDQGYFKANDATGNPVLYNTNGKKHYAISRGNGANYDAYINLVKTTITQASTGLVDAVLSACGSNYRNFWNQSSGRQVRYVLVFSHLIEAEALDVIGIMEAYLANYGKNLIPPAIPSGLTATLISGGVKWDWTAGDAAAQTEIWCRNDSGAYTTATYTINAGTVTKSETTTPVDLRYCKIRSLKNGLYSAFTSEVSIAMLGAEKLNQTAWKAVSLATYWDTACGANWSGDTTKITSNGTGELGKQFWTIGKTYRVAVDCLYTSGSLDIRDWATTIHPITGSGVTVINFIPVTEYLVIKSGTTPFIGSISALSVKEILFP
jgi:hypothetical protein